MTKNDIDTEKKRYELEDIMKKFIHVASVQMLLDDSKEMARYLKQLAADAIFLKEKKDKKKVKNEQVYTHIKTRQTS